MVLIFTIRHQSIAFVQNLPHLSCSCLLENYFDIIFEDFVFSFEGLAILIYKLRRDLKSWEVFCMEVADKLIPLEESK
ncbi:hypothetical protein L798_06338 [Zootermopsis nevadensis]|uniref:Uncharacterized protein n=1 Tax=Zootermopsis nevadensis TaxID=136037 RepID=A0A067RFX3_ZOONE|nr:hypothetical protein L798_06338 [Zootermopsis nevadensis]